MSTEAGGSEQKSGDGPDPWTQGRKSGPVLGFRVLAYSGVQGLALLIGNFLQLGTIAVVAVYLGPADLGRYSLLFFLGALITMIFSLAAKPGTIRRTFGAGDDDDDDDEGDEAAVSASPKRTLGAGILWSAALGLLVTVLVVIFREPVADLLLGDGTNPDLVLWAGIFGGAGVLFRVASISLWFEHRPSAFLIVEIGRPLIALVVMIALLAAGGGLTAAIAGVAVGSAIAATVAALLLRGSFEPNLDPQEVLAIIKGGGRRVPIITSLWVIQNADVFLLSRFVDHTDLGVYALASKLGIVVSFLPQGFRTAMRPLRKSPAFKAVRSEYGRPVADGQILGYFVLICITSVLLMVLAGELLVSVAPPEFEDAAPLIPLTATALVMPALWRTVNGQTSWPDKTRKFFVLATVGAALIFVGVCVLLAPEIGIYAAPVAMLTGFAVPIIYFFVRGQRSEGRIEFPYTEVGKALAVALVLSVAYHLIPDIHPIAQLAIIVLFMGIYAVLLLVLRVVPENHWPALSEMMAAIFTGRPDRVNPRRGLRALGDEDRARLRVAVTERVPLAALTRPAQVPENVLRSGKRLGPLVEGTEGGRLVWALRGVGREIGSPVRRRSEQDGALAEFLFADEPPAVRSATMRRLLNEGADPADLRGLEDLMKHLAKVPPDAWEGEAAADSPVARRRRAAGRRGRAAMSRAAKAIGRRI